MNILVIPSWYPSVNYPLNGIFIKEQTYQICKLDSNIHTGISLWGQKDIKNLLWWNDPLKNISKITGFDNTASTKKILLNLTEYVKPQLIWTRKILKGNIQGIIKANLKNLKSFEKDYGPVDLIHAHVGYPAGRVAFELSKRFGIPYVITEHMIPFPSHYDADKQGNLKPYYMEPYLHAATNIAVGESLANTMTLMGLPHVKTVPNFIDEFFFKPLNRTSNSAIPSTFTFFTLCEIIPRKGIDVLLRAIKILSDQGIKADFRIGGTGPEIERYKTMAKMFAIDGHVEWLGSLTRGNALNEHQSASAFVLPSHDESMGIVYIEALACGKPIIATRCGGPETIVNKANGILVEKNNPQELANAMIKMINNRSLYNSQTIRQDFLNRFSKKAVIPQLIDLYQQVISEHTPTP